MIQSPSEEVSPVSIKSVLEELLQDIEKDRGKSLIRLITEPREEEKENKTPDNANTISAEEIQQFINILKENEYQRVLPQEQSHQSLSYMATGWISTESSTANALSIAFNLYKAGCDFYLDKRFDKSQEMFSKRPKKISRSNGQGF